MISLIFSLAVAGLLAYIVYDFVAEYRAAAGTTWQRIVAAGKKTETILWARFVALVGCLTDLLVQAADWLNAPGLTDAIREAMQPQYVAGFIIAVALVTEFARRYKATDVRSSR